MSAHLEAAQSFETQKTRNDITRPHRLVPCGDLRFPHSDQAGGKEIPESLIQVSKVKAGNLEGLFLSSATVSALARPHRRASRAHMHNRRSQERLLPLICFWHCGGELSN